jgi:hypothetical protein
MGRADIEADIDGVGVVGGDGHHVGLPGEVNVFAALAAGYEREWLIV